MSQCPTCGRGGGIQRKEATVAFTDGHVEKYRVTPQVEMYYERVYSTTIGALSNGPSTAGYQLVWEAMRAAKKGQVVPSLEAWLETTDACSIDMVDIVPLESGQSPDGSPASPSPSELPQAS